MAKSEDAGQRLLKLNQIKSLEDLMEAILIAVFFSAFLFAGFAAISFSTIDSDNHSNNRK